MTIEFIKNTQDGRFRKTQQVELVNSLARKYISAGEAKEIKFITVEEIFRRSSIENQVEKEIEKEVMANEIIDKKVKKKSKN